MNKSALPRSQADFLSTIVPYLLSFHYYWTVKIA
jgi:hypothetical protein